MGTLSNKLSQNYPFQLAKQEADCFLKKALDSTVAKYMEHSWLGRRYSSRFAPQQAYCCDDS